MPPSPRTLLLTAAQENNLQRIKELFLEHPSIDTVVATASNRYSLIHWAVHHNNLDMLRFLISKGVAINYLNQERITPIELAAQKGYWDCAATLAENFSILLLYYKALVHAISVNRATADKLFVANCCARWSLTDTGNTLLHLAAENGDLAMICFLVDDKCFSTSAKNKVRKIPIELAVEKEHWECAKYLASQQINARDNTHFYRALKIAVPANKEKARELLEENKYSRTPLADTGDTLLHLAAIDGDIETIRFLISQGFSATTANNNDKTPLQLAAQAKKWDCVKVFAECANAEEDSAPYSAALLTVIITDELSSIEAKRSAVRALLESKKASVHYHSLITGNTALHIAARKKDLHIIRLLQEHGASATAENYERKPPLQVAIDNKNWANALALSIDVYSTQYDQQPFVKMYAYFLSTCESGGSDYEKRWNDFIDLLRALETSQATISTKHLNANPEFMARTYLFGLFKGSSRYLDIKQLITGLPPDTLKTSYTEFKRLVGEQKFAGCETAKALHNAVYSPPTAASALAAH